MAGNVRAFPRTNRKGEEPRSAYDFAAEAFARAEYDTCREHLQVCAYDAGRDSIRATLLRARLARLEGELETWYHASGVAARETRSTAERLTALALRGLAEKQLAKDREARRTFAELEASLEAATAADGAYAVYLIAVDAWQDRDLARAERLIRRTLDALPDPESLSLLGWIEVGRERYRVAGSHFMAALSRHRASGNVNVRMQVRAVHAAAIIASETVDLGMGRQVRKEYEALTWPSSLRVERFNTLTCLRFLALLEGDIERAWLLSRDAVFIAPLPSYVAIAETNAAVACRMLGDENAYLLQLRRAWEIVRTEKWGRADAEQRVALTNFMIEAGRTMPEDVRKAVTMYESLAPRPNAANALHADRRVAAFEALAAGRVHEMLGARDSAILQYRRSLELWTELGYVMRAALVALDLRRITRDERYAAPVHAALTLAPNAWFAREVGAPQRALEGIRPAQRAVLSRLLEGRSAKAIASELGRGSHTIANHTRRIFASFGVRSRAALRERCADLGITAAALREPSSLHWTDGTNARSRQTKPLGKKRRQPRRTTAAD